MLDALMMLVDDVALGDGGAMMMQPGDALLMPYVFRVFIDACGWIPCCMMPWSHEFSS